MKYSSLASSEEIGIHQSSNDYLDKEQKQEAWNKAIFTKQATQPSNIDSQRSLKYPLSQHHIAQMYAMSPQEEDDNYRQSTVIPGVVPAGNTICKQNDSETDIHKIYTQKQYTEIALSILNSLKTPSSQKKFKSIRPVGRVGSLPKRESGLSTGRQEHNNSVGNPKESLYKSSIASRVQVRSLKERFLNIVNEYEPQFSEYNSKRWSEEKPKQNYSSGYKSNLKEQKNKEKLFQKELEDKYHQLKQESQNQWEQSFGQKIPTTQPHFPVDTNKLLRSYQKRGINGERESNIDNKNYFARRNLTNGYGIDNLQTSFDSKSNEGIISRNPPVVAKYESYGISNKNVMSGSISNRNTFGQNEMPQIQNQNKALKNSKSVSQQIKSNSKSNQAKKQISALNEAINKNKFA